MHRLTLAIYAPVVAAAGLAAFAGLQPFVDPRLLFLDPMIAGVVSGDCCRSWYGFMSTLGVMAWMAGGAVALFAALVMIRIGRAREDWLPLLLAGTISLGFAVDDVFLVHENLAPKLGIPQVVVLAIYALLALGYLALCWRQLLAYHPVLFGLAGGSLALSLGFDLFGLQGTMSTIVVEDGAKFVGIAAWTSYHIALAGNRGAEAGLLSAPDPHRVSRTVGRRRTESPVYRAG